MLALLHTSEEIKVDIEEDNKSETASLNELNLSNYEDAENVPDIQNRSRKALPIMTRSKRQNPPLL